ncbi:MAG: SH3 domain-containing protein, partial [Desulfobacterales bacterium]|nr:SH3 domain-containing protein [Desulfobacterales bacterium]
MKYRSTIVLFFVLTLTVSLLPTWPRPAPCLAAEFRIGTVTANVNLRKTPGLQGAVVAGLQKGLPVKVYGEKDSWYRVSANKNYTLINGWIYKRYVEIVSTQSGPARPEVSTPQPLPEAPSEKPLPALLKTAPLPEPAPVPEKTAPAKAPKLEIPPEKSALPAAQKHALPPTTGKTAPASSTKSTDTARLLLSISPLVLAIIALLVAARA